MQESLLSQLRGTLRFDEAMAEHTTLKAGGPADIWFEPVDIDDLKAALKFCNEQNVKFFIIGNGSNLLVKDEGFRGMAIRLSGEPFRAVQFKDNKVRAGAGIHLAEFLYRLSDNALSGLEFMAGIPATLGGTLVMNAGIRTQDGAMAVGDAVVEVKALSREGKERVFSKEELKFGYRDSNLQELVLLEAVFALEKDDKEKITAKMKEYRDVRRKKHDYSHPNAGCIFKNPQDGIETAGELIERMGLKGYEKGNVAVSDRHANFILNKSGKAAAGEVLKVIKYIRAKAKSSYGINLKLEIKVV